MKILVMRGGGVGDFILTLPVLAALRRHFTGASLELLGYPGIASLAVAAGLAERVAPIESLRLTGFFAAEGAKLDAEARDYFASFNVIVSYLHDPDGILRRNIERCTAARFVAGPHRPDEMRRRHATRILLQPLGELGIHDADPCPRLELPGKPETLPGVWIAAHPGSGSPRKNWPEAFWADLLDRLPPGVNILLIGGEAEGDRCRRLLAPLPASRVRLAENLPLVDLAQRMKPCRAYIGHDSGITHLAAALGLPGIALWGPTDEITWRPVSERIQLIRPGTTAELVIRRCRELPV